MKRSIVFLMMALFIASCKKEGSNPVESIGVQEIPQVREMPQRRYRIHCRPAWELDMS